MKESLTRVDPFHQRLPCSPSTISYNSNWIRTLGHVSLCHMNSEHCSVLCAQSRRSEQWGLLLIIECFNLIDFKCKESLCLIQWKRAYSIHNFLNSSPLLFPRYSSFSVTYLSFYARSLPFSFPPSTYFLSLSPWICPKRVKYNGVINYSGYWLVSGHLHYVTITMRWLNEIQVLPKWSRVRIPTPTKTVTC